MNNDIIDMWINDLNDDNKPNEKTINIVKLLYKNNIINKDILKKFAPLVFMIKNNFNMYDIELFLKSGININEIDNNGYFPLFMSIIKNDLSLVKFILKYKADVNQLVYILYHMN